jgi:hypothetical protein
MKIPHVAVGALLSVAAMAAALAQTPAPIPATPPPIPATPAPAPADTTTAPAASPPDTSTSKPAQETGTSKPAVTSPPADTSPLAPLGWLEGCWRGEVNQREYREHWLPLRGGLMLGASHTVMAGKTQSYEYLRLEPRGDGVYYVNIAMAPGQQETAFKLSDRTMDREDEIFTFTNATQDFPHTLSYRHNDTGWLYVTVEGTVNSTPKKVIYPMHRIDCKTGEGIRK